MASPDELRDIELRRLAELEKQRAYHGIDTDPEILLEIADIRARYGADAHDTPPHRVATTKDTVAALWLEIDLIRALAASALRMAVDWHQWRNRLLYAIGVLAVVSGISIATLWLVLVLVSRLGGL